MALLRCCIIYYMATNAFVLLVNKEWVLLSLPRHCLHERCRWKIPFRRNKFADSYKFIKQSGLLKFPNLEILGELSKHKLHFHCASSCTLALVHGRMHHNYHNIILHLFLYKTPSSTCGILTPITVPGHFCPISPLMTCTMFSQGSTSGFALRYFLGFIWALTFPTRYNRSYISLGRDVSCTY